MKCVKCNEHQAPPGDDTCQICSVEEFTEAQMNKKSKTVYKNPRIQPMNEKRSELKVVWAAIAIIACQVLGIDVTALSALLGVEGADILDTIKQAHSGDGGAYAAALAGVYALARAYVKGKLK